MEVLSATSFWKKSPINTVYPIYVAFNCKIKGDLKSKLKGHFKN
jgi:hypothetical protein